MPSPLHDTVLFDLGAVLVDWNPRYLYRRHFDGDEAAMERFLDTVCPGHWVREMDAGKPIAQAIAERSRDFPEHAPLIRLWGTHWETMLRGPIEDTVEILAALKRRGTRLYALTNWSAENFPIARRRFDFFDWFADIVVSGEVGLAKPDPRIYRVAIERCRLAPAQTVFVDDNVHNVAAGERAGLHALHFTTPVQLRADLGKLGLL
ncbi:MAG TPA: HAD family phosphatase [Burkholderiales bacterium]|nr:HAD family phosphatase [Burkholderiales bacterium]